MSSLDWSALLDGLAVTLELLAITAVAGLTLGLLLALARMSGIRVLAWPVLGLVSVLRGTPLLAQIFLIYYGLAQFPAVRHSVLWPVLRHAWPCAILAFSLNMSAYASEVIRAALGAVPRGEREAAAALGLTGAQAFRAVVLPRAFRLGLPALTNEVLVQLKATALASTITVLDLTGAARRLSAASFSPMPLLAAGAIYAVLALMIGGATHLLERRRNAGGGRA